MAKVRTALIFSVINQHSSQIISLATTVVLARLLTPAEIGVYAVAASFTFLASELRALGAGLYLVREKEINPEKIRSAMGLMIVVSWGLASVIAICSPFIAEFYDEKALRVIFLILAFSFVLAPFASVSHALLIRNMQFRSLFIVKLNSTLVRSGSTIGLVLLGYSYYGMAWGVIAGSISEVLLLSLYRVKGTPWLPSFSRFKELFHFGLYTSIANTLTQFSLSIPDLVLGRVATMTDVGLFSRGLGVLTFLNNFMGNAVGPVVLPHLSEVKRTGGSVAESYLQAITFQSAIVWPVFAVVNLCAFSMVRALFGDQWDVAAPIASVLALWAILQSTHSFSSAALLAVEKEKWLFAKELAIFTVRVIAVVTAAFHGMLMVAWAMVLTGVFEVMVNTWVIRKSVHLGVRQIAKSLFPNVVLATSCWVSLKLLGMAINFEALNPWIALLVIGVCMLGVWLLTLWLTRNPVWDIVRQLVGAVYRRSAFQKIK